MPSKQKSRIKNTVPPLYMGRISTLLLSSLLALFIFPSCGTRLELLPEVPGASTGSASYSVYSESKPIASTSPELFDTGPEIREKMASLIDSAEDYILICSFLLTSDPDTQGLLEALQKKQEKGVRVLVLADSCARYKPGGKEAFRFLEEAGIEIAEYNPIRAHKLIVAPAMLPRDHRKFWIVDGETLFLGGANLYSASLRAPRDNGNLDLMVSIDSPEAIEAMIESFAATWNRSSKLEMKPDEFAVRSRSRMTTELWLAEQNKDADRGDQIAKMFNGLFSLAKEEIWLIQPYTFVSEPMLQQFRDLKERGVTVNVMLSDKVESPRFSYASLYGAKDIIEAGGKVWIYESGQCPLHTKAVIIDRNWASVGSANLNFRSLYLSKETNLVFNDSTSVNKVLANLNELIDGCRQIELDEAEEYRGANYYFAWILMQLLG